MKEESGCEGTRTEAEGAAFRLASYCPVSSAGVTEGCTPTKTPNN